MDLFALPLIEVIVGAIFFKLKSMTSFAHPSIQLFQIALNSRIKGLGFPTCCASPL